jgi:hypothetical protein
VALPQWVRLALLVELALLSASRPAGNRARRHAFGARVLGGQADGFDLCSADVHPAPADRVGLTSGPAPCRADPVRLTAIKEDIAMTSQARRRTSSEVRAILEQLQLLADRPQLRHRLGYGRVTTKAPYADSRRPTDPRQGWRIDNRSRKGDQDSNYAVGLL